MVALITAALKGLASIPTIADRIDQLIKSFRDFQRDRFIQKKRDIVSLIDSKIRDDMKGASSDEQVEDIVNHIADLMADS